MEIGAAQTQPAMQNQGSDLAKYMAAGTTKPASQLKSEGISDAEIKNLKKLGKLECSSCASRKYVDGSDDPGVSFKTPQGIAPGQSAQKVMGHEREHFVREAASAKRENREVVSNTIKIMRDVCPECGASYVAGGETRTVTKGKGKREQEKEHFMQQDYEKKIAPHFGSEMDQFA